MAPPIFGRAAITLGIGPHFWFKHLKKFMWLILCGIKMLISD